MVTFRNPLQRYKELLEYANFGRGYLVKMIKNYSKKIQAKRRNSKKDTS